MLGQPGRSARRRRPAAPSSTPNIVAIPDHPSASSRVMPLRCRRRYSSSMYAASRGDLRRIHDRWPSRACMCSSASALADRRFVSQQDRRRDLLVHQNLARAQDLVLLAFGKHHALGRSLRLVDHDAHHFAAPCPAAAPVARGIRAMSIGSCATPVSMAALRHRRRLPDQHARIERLRNDVLAARTPAAPRRRRAAPNPERLLWPAPPAPAWPPASSRR